MRADRYARETPEANRSLRLQVEIVLGKKYTAPALRYERSGMPQFPDGRLELMPAPGRDPYTRNSGGREAIQELRKTEKRLAGEGNKFVVRAENDGIVCTQD